MKKVVMVCFVVLVILVPVFLFIVGCFSEDMCTKPTEPDYHYIRFTLDGPEMDAEEIIILNFGRPDVDAENPMVTLSPDEDSMNYSGTYCFHTSTPPDVMFEMYGWLYPNTPGEYIGTYGGLDTPVGYFSTWPWITENGEVYMYHTVDGTIEITSFGDVGGDVVGTFDLTYESDNIPAPSYGSPLPITGDFRLLRVSDTYWPDWAY